MARTDAGASRHAESPRLRHYRCCHGVSSYKMVSTVVLTMPSIVQCCRMHCMSRAVLFSVNMPSQRPPTPPSSESGSKMSSRVSTTESQSPQSTPLKRKRDKAIVIPNDGVMEEEPYFLDDQSMQRVTDLLIQDKPINDDCINRVLEISNPDPTDWYVASTHLIPPGDHYETASPKHKDFLSNPSRRLLIPLHLPSMSHWLLVTFDRKHKRCLVYDPLGSRRYIELALRTVQKFLNGHGL
jgi:hypothetical protein